MTGFQPLPCGHISDTNRHNLAARELLRPCGDVSLASSELRASIGIKLDQSITSSCVAHALPKAVEMSFRLQGQDSILLSPDGSYKSYRQVALDAETPVGLPLGPLADGGVQIQYGVYAMEKLGARVVDPNALAFGTDVDPATVNNKLTLPEREGAVRITGLHGIASSESDTAELVQRSLVSGCPVLFGAFVDEAFMGWSAENPVFDFADPRDPKGGRHAMVVVGHKKLRGGMTVYWLLSSWGERFGDGGCILVSEKFLLTGDSFYATKAKVLP